MGRYQFGISGRRLVHLQIHDAAVKYASGQICQWSNMPVVKYASVSRKLFPQTKARLGLYNAFAIAIIDIWIQWIAFMLIIVPLETPLGVGVLCCNSNYNKPSLFFPISIYQKIFPLVKTMESAV